MRTRKERLEAFEAVHSRYSELLEGLLWKLTGGEELFTEALQYSLLAVWKHVERLNGDRAGGYIYRIAQTAAATAWRKSKRQKPDDAVRNERHQQSAEEAINNKEQVSLVRRAISVLPGKQGGAIIMRYLQERDYDSIGIELGCSPVTARSHVTKGLAELKRKLANKI